MTYNLNQQRVNKKLKQVTKHADGEFIFASLEYADEHATKNIHE